jgi:hypothetical protein
LYRGPSFAYIAVELLSEVSETDEFGFEDFNAGLHRGEDGVVGVRRLRAVRLRRVRLCGLVILERQSWSRRPHAEQRLWRTVTRKKYQLRGERVRLQNQVESLHRHLRTLGYRIEPRNSQPTQTQAR